MAIKVQCKSCGKALNAPTNAAGRVLACPGCKGKISVPSLLDDELAIGINPDGLWDTIAREMPEVTASPASVVLAPATTYRKHKRSAIHQWIPLMIIAGLLLVGFLAVVLVVVGLGNAWNTQYKQQASKLYASGQQLVVEGRLRESYDEYGNLLHHLGSRPGNPELSTMWDKATSERERIWPLIKAEIEREELEQLASAAEQEYKEQRAKAARQAQRLNEEREQRLEEAQREAHPKVLAAMEGWLKTQKLGEAGDMFLAGSSPRTKLYALREYEILKVELDFKYGNVSVRASYSNEDGQPVIRVWNFRVEPNTAGDWRIVSMTPQA